MSDSECASERTKSQDPPHLVEEEAPTEQSEPSEIQEQDDTPRASETEESNAKGPHASGLLRRLRNALLFFVALWLAMILLRAAGTKRPSKVIYANRYSEDYKFRPAASPILTERLQDGRTRIRGAEPSTRAVPPARETPKPNPKKRKTSSKKKNARGTK